MIDHSRHVPLRDVPWDPGAAKAAIAEIAADALAHFGPDPFWPGHPLDDQRRHSGIYYGATGVVWGLEYLRRIGAIDSDFDFKPHLPQLLTNIQADMTAYGDYAAHGSLLAGDMGTALVAMRLAPSAAMAEPAGAGDASRGRGAICLGGRAARKRLQSLPWHRRQWLRVSRAPSANPAHRVARTRSGVRDDGHCTVPRGTARIRTRSILALDGRCGPCDLSLGLPDRPAALSHGRCILK